METYAQILRGLLGDNPLILLETGDGIEQKYFLSDPDLEFVADKFLETLLKNKQKGTMIDDL